MGSKDNKFLIMSVIKQIIYVLFRKKATENKTLQINLDLKLNL